MTKLYKKNELMFALVWIAIYVVGTSLAEALCEALGVVKLVSAAFHLALTVILLLWVRRNDLTEKCGLFLPRYRLSSAWFFLPLVLVGLYKLFFSPAFRLSPMESVLYVVSMLCVGFLEEIIFRGFLFRAIEKENLTRAIIISSDARCFFFISSISSLERLPESTSAISSSASSVKTAIIISSVTFGIGHIVNLINGQDLPETILQIIFAIIVGFALVVLFYKGKSLVPCIVFHSVFNSLSIVANDEAMLKTLGGPVTSAAILVAASAVVLGGYTFWNWKHLEG